MSLLADFPSTTVEITIGYLTINRIKDEHLSTTVEITIGYLTCKALFVSVPSTTVEITIGYLTNEIKLDKQNLQQ